ncbi:P-loop containing nucleoside triphosphate hydrolase protein [Hypomontagnella submonticulosa]|nr:P-loop containing nucleoside triphosphate hydrolase protein [Hypomontagnella submonticulosa]
MADPLSIAASVAGLIALSGSIYSALSAHVSRANSNTPQSAYTLLLTVLEMRSALISVSSLVTSFLSVPPERRALVQLDHLIVCLTQSVLTFSDLEAFVGTWPEDIQSSRWKRWRWTFQGDKFAILNTKIQDHKLSLNLVLNILQCESDIEAQRSRESLNAMMHIIVEENADLRRKILGLGPVVQSTAQSVTTAARTINTVDETEASTSQPPLNNKRWNQITTYISESDEDDASTIRGKQTRSRLDDENQSHRTSWLLPSIHASRRSSSIFEYAHARPFEKILASTWVYARVKGVECDVSFATSHSVSAVWSMLSGLSLSQVSTVSVIALPISLEDVLNSSWYQANIETQLMEKTYKIAVLGDHLVGKSALTRRFCQGIFQDKIDPTIQDSYSKFAVVDSTYCHISIIDTPGLDDYEVLMRQALTDADGFIVAFSMMDYDSFRRVRLIHGLLSKLKGLDGIHSSSVAIVATKSDLEVPKVVGEDEARSLAMELRCHYFQCSAKTGFNIEAPFLELIRMLRDEKTKTEMTVSLPSSTSRSQSLGDLHHPTEDMLDTTTPSDKLRTM